MRNALAAALVAPLLVCIVALQARAQSTGTIRGRITSAANREPIPDVAVRVEGGAAAAVSDASGRYFLSGVPLGTRAVLAQRVGFERGRTIVVVSADSSVTADFSLSEATVTLPGVIVTASREEERPEEVPASVGVVSGAEIATSRPHHPAEIVGRIPGALVVDLGGEGNVVSLRQPINYSAVYAYLEDGIPIRSTGFFNHNALYEINVPGAERIEVLKGPGTALYGSDAIGGVFNVLTRPPSAAPDVELFAEGGAYGYARTLASASDRWGEHGVRADANVTHFRGWRDQAHFNRQSGTLRWDWARSANSHLRTILTASNINSPGDGGSDVSRADFDSRSTVNYTPIALRKVQAVRLSSTYEIETGRSLLSVTAYGRYNRLNLLPSWQLTYDPQVWDSHNRSLGLMVKYRRILAAQASLVVGADVDWSPGERVEDQILPTQTGNVFSRYTLGVRQYDYAVTFHGLSPYAQVDLAPARRLHINAGVRLDATGYDYTNHLTVDDTSAHRRPPSGSVSYTHLSPKLGLAYELGDGASVFASYRHGFRVPSEDQLFVQGSAVNTVGLEPVRANSYEAGVRGRVGRLELEASAYTMEISHDILTFFDTLNFTSQTSNAGRTRHWGVEAGVGLALARDLRADVAVSALRHRYLKWVTATGSDFSGNDMESGPRDLGNARLTWSPADHSFVLEWSHVGRYFTDPDNLHSYGGFNVFNLSCQVALTKAFALLGRVNNLADVRYANTVSFNPFVPPAQQDRFTPGQRRSLFLGIQYTRNHAGSAR